MSEKSRKELSDLLKKYGASSEGPYSSTLPAEKLYLLNSREKASLDIQHAYLVVAWLAVRSCLPNLEVSLSVDSDGVAQSKLAGWQLAENDERGKNKVASMTRL